jgi:O-antigen/teichoic acid export membrane protein
MTFIWFFINKINKDILWIGLGQIVSLGSNFALLAVLTNQLNLTNYGYYSIWLSLLLFVRQILYDPLSIVAAKDVALTDIDEVRYRDYFQILNFATDILLKSLFLIYLLVIFAQFISLEAIEYFLYLSLGLMYLVSNGAQGVYVNFLNVLRFRGQAAIIVASDGLVKLVLVIFFINLFHDPLQGALFGVATSAFFTYFFYRWKITSFGNFGKLHDKKYSIKAKDWFVASLPLVTPIILIALRSSADKWLMARIVGVEDLAAYSVLLQLGFLPLVMIIGVFQTYLSPEIYKMTNLMKREGREIFISWINKILIKITMFSIICTLIAYFLSSYIMTLIVGVDYLPYATFLPLFVLSGALFSMSAIICVAVIGFFGSRVVGYLMCLNVLTGLLCTFGLLQLSGFEGGVIGLLVSSLLSLVIYYVAIVVLPLENSI